MRPIQFQDLILSLPDGIFQTSLFQAFLNTKYKPQMFNYKFHLNTLAMTAATIRTPFQFFHISQTALSSSQI
jgi:hypothetical protein